MDGMRGHAVIQLRQQREFALCPPLPLRGVAYAGCTLVYDEGVKNSAR
jgi:hypothetical protein